MKTCICTILNNDHKYLKEFIDYYLSIGFDHIFFYETNNSLTHTDIVNEYKDKVTLTRISKLNIKIENHWVHKSLYNYFIDEYKFKYDWCLFLDNIGAFMMFNNNYDLDILVKNPRVKAYLLRWKIYTADGHIKTPSSGTLFDNYTIQTFDYENVNDHKVYNVFVHISALEDNERFDNKFTNIIKTSLTYDISENRKLINDDFVLFGKQIDIKKCWLNVYYTKSWQDWCEMIFSYIQGEERLLRNTQFMLDTFFIINKDMEEYDEFLLHNEIFIRYAHDAESHSDNSNEFKNYILTYKYDGIQSLVNWSKHNASILLRGKREQKNKTAILFLAGNMNKVSIDHYTVIKESIRNTEYDNDMFWAIGNDNNFDELNLNIYNGAKYFIFNYDELKEKYGNRLTFWPNKELFNTVLVLQDFSDKYPQYDYIWLIEYDVILSDNNWLSFFRNFDENYSDFLASNICALGLNGFNFNKDVGPYISNLNNKEYKQIQSFNSIMRLSRNAAQYMSDYYKRGGEGFFEFTLATILYNNGFKIEDIGGNGEYVNSKNKGKWYIDGIHGNTGSNGFIRLPSDIIKNMQKINKSILIHPVKYIVD